MVRDRRKRRRELETIGRACEKARLLVIDVPSGAPLVDVPLYVALLAEIWAPMPGGEPALAFKGPVQIRLRP